MGYYGRGDYYRGDYYRGDPFIGGLLAKAGAAILPKVGGLIGKAASWLTKGKLIGAGGGMEAAKTIGKVAATAGTGVAIFKAAQPMLPDMGSLPMMGGGGEQGGGPMIEVSRDGRRIRKRWSSRKGRYVAIRTMNPLNPRALTRAIRRASRFERFARTVVSTLHSGPKKFKSKRRKG